MEAVLAALREAGDGAQLNERLLEALNNLGTAYRGDWSDFDGRTLRNELEQWSALARDLNLTTDEIEAWEIGAGLCERCRSSWINYYGESKRLCRTCESEAKSA